jgi:DegV family protein with EDD domain
MNKEKIMSNYEIVIESTCDLDSSLRERFHLYKEVIRGVVYLPSGDILADTDWNNYSSDEFYKIVKKNAGKVHTAFAPMEEFERVVLPILKEGKDVMVFTISSAISGTYNGFRNFAEIILDDFPGRKIEIVDTLKYASAGGLLAIYAAQNRDNGMSFEDNVKWCNVNRNCLHEIGPMDDLRFLAKNGRIKAGKAFFGQLAGVQPAADFTLDGKSQPLGTVRGDKAVDKLCLEYLLRTIEKPEDQIIIVAHSNRKERALRYKEQLEKALKAKEVLIVEVGQSTGPNVGPGLCVYFYMGRPLTEDRAEETKIFLELKENA